MTPMPATRKKTVVKHADPPEASGRSARKRKAVLDAATEMFFHKGYLGVSMDEIAALALVSKQTAYAHFSNKETLFVEMVTQKCKVAGDQVIGAMRKLEPGEDVQAYLLDYAYRQLTIVLTPPLMQLRRLVIGEVNRFPELARALYDYGPKRAIVFQKEIMTHLDRLGLLTVSDPLVAASHFNWLVMGGPINAAMLLGDTAIPNSNELHSHAIEAVRVFLAAYGRK
jgi:TetR/AcrR family transcriptional regulator, mexJK operon transcriptional repressor